MLAQCFFCSNIHDNYPSLATPLRGSPVGHPLPLTTHTLTNLFTCTGEDLISVNTPYRKIYRNLTLQKKLALNNLKTNQSIVIKPCDKDEDICIMNARDYLINIHTHIRDHKHTNHSPKIQQVQWSMIHALS